MTAWFRSTAGQLVEAGDFESGTSSKSSKLVHGGLRYRLTLDERRLESAYVYYDRAQAESYRPRMSHAE